MPGKGPREIRNVKEFLDALNRLFRQLQGINLVMRGGYRFSIEDDLRDWRRSIIKIQPTSWPEGSLIELVVISKTLEPVIGFIRTPHALVPGSRTHFHLAFDIEGSGKKDPKEKRYRLRHLIARSGNRPSLDLVRLAANRNRRPGPPFVIC
ncbi:MAG: hypothetical protein ACM3NH_04025 [Candidatus Saccharibacteria bacterium]